MHLGDENKALDLLERAYDERVGYMLMIGHDWTTGSSPRLISA